MSTVKRNFKTQKRGLKFGRKLREPVENFSFDTHLRGGGGVLVYEHFFYLNKF